MHTPPGLRCKNDYNEGTSGNESWHMQRAIPAYRYRQRDRYMLWSPEGGLRAVWIHFSMKYAEAMRLWMSDKVFNGNNRHRTGDRYHLLDGSNRI